MVRVKICCIQSLEEIRLAAAAGADAVGLVAAMPSGPGPIPDERIATIIMAAPTDLTTVLLTARTTPDTIADHIRTCRPKAVQIVDWPEPGTHAGLRAAFPGLQMFQVIHVRSPADVAQACQIAPLVDHILLDSGAPDAATRTLGGTGRIHDWSLSRQIVETCGKPVWLAGGLNPENVRHAIAEVRPHGVDICSGLRPNGALDPGRLTTFMSEVRAA